MVYYVGVVNSFDTSKGYGFISSAQIQGDVFLGTHDLPAELQQAVVHPGLFELGGRTVQFGVGSRDGKTHATDVALAPAEGLPTVGTVVSYNDQKGYGFIGVSGLEGGDVFFSKRDIPPHMHAFDGRSFAGKIASFIITPQENGKPQAKNIRFCDSGGTQAASSPKAGLGALRDGQGAMGTVTSHNVQRGFGFLACQASPGVELYFKSSEPIPIGTDLAFYVKILPDGVPQARDITAALFEGQTAVGTVIRYVPRTGFGFIRIPDQPGDVHFRKDVVPAELQEQELEGSTARFTVTIHRGMPQASSFQLLAHTSAGYVAPSAEQGIKRAVAGVGSYAAQAGVVGHTAQGFPVVTPTVKRPRVAGQVAASASGRTDAGAMTGWVVSFNPMKGFGFIQSPRSTNGDVYFKALNLPAEHQQRSDLVGVQVVFQGSRMPDGKLQANSLQVLG